MHKSVFEILHPQVCSTYIYIYLNDGEVFFEILNLLLCTQMFKNLIKVVICLNDRYETT